MTTPDPDQPEGVPPMFDLPGVSPDFAADLLARVQAHMAAVGLQREMLSPLDTEAVQLHVAFEALTGPGRFTEDQALKYLAWRTG